MSQSSNQTTPLYTLGQPRNEFRPRDYQEFRLKHKLELVTHNYL